MVGGAVGASKFDVFYLALALWIVADLTINYTRFSQAGLGVVRYVLLGAAICLLVMRVAMSQRYTPAQLLAVMVLALLAAVTSYLSRSEAMLALALFVVAAQGINAHRLCRVAFVSTTFALALVVLLCLAGALPDVVLMRGGAARHAFGFKHPNMLGAALLSSATCLFAWRWQSIRFYHYLYALALLLVAVFVADARTAASMIALLMAMSAVCARNRNLLCRAWLAWIVVLAAVISVLLAAFYSPNVKPLRVLDLMLSERLYYANVYYQLYGFSLLGQQITSAATMLGGIYTGTLDNAYVHMAIEFGFVSLALYVCAMTAGMRAAAQHRDAGLMCACLVYALFGLSETYMYNVAFDFAPVVGCVALYGSGSIAFRGAIGRGRG